MVELQWGSSNNDNEKDDRQEMQWQRLWRNKRWRQQDERDDNTTWRWGQTGSDSMLCIEGGDGKKSDDRWWGIARSRTDHNEDLVGGWLTRFGKGGSDLATMKISRLKCYLLLRQHQLQGMYDCYGTMMKEFNGGGDNNRFEWYYFFLNFFQIIIDIFFSSFWFSLFTIF